MPSIYSITNIVTKDIYIGKTTKTIDERFKRHAYCAKYSSQTHLHRAIRKYGIENFQIELLEETSMSNLDEREQYFIEYLKPQYNMTKGGEGGDTSSSPNYQAQMRILQSRNKGSNNPMYGRKRPDTAIYLLKAKAKCLEANRCPVVCEGTTFASVGDAQSAYPGISIRKRLDNPKYPEFYRLRDKTKRK